MFVFYRRLHQLEPLDNLLDGLHVPVRIRLIL